MVPNGQEHIILIILDHFGPSWPFVHLNITWKRLIPLSLSKKGPKTISDLSLVKINSS